VRLVPPLVAPAAPGVDGGMKAALDHTAVIRKEDGKFCVRSPDNPDWNGGCYDTKGEAEKRLRQVEFFKRQSAARVLARYLSAQAG